jgi:DNA-binding HxlR family transcriptional regulator
VIYFAIKTYAIMDIIKRRNHLIRTDPMAAKTACTRMILPVRDALDMLNGKWKLPILISLSFGNKRFRQIANEIPHITDRMLSKELKDLEMNQLVNRTVYDSSPVIVEYSMTEYGKSLDKVIEELAKWGMRHRSRIMGK